MALPLLWEAHPKEDIMKTKLLFTMSAALLTTAAFATPTIYPKDLTFLGQIRNPTNSNLVADDSDLKVIWVMPPNTATSKVEGLHTITSNVGYCKEMANLQSYSASMSERMKELRLKEMDSQEEVRILSLKISEARQELARYVAQNNLADIQNLDDRLTIVESEINGLNDRLSTCGDNCHEILSQLKELRNERLKLTKDRRLLSQTKVRQVREMEKKKSSVEGYQKDLEDSETRWEKISKRLEDMRQTFNDMYESFGKLEGARAAIAFESNWDENINELQIQNPGFDFKRILTQNAVVITNLIGAGELPGTGAVMGYEIGGTYTDGKITYPSYPQSLSGNVRLSLIGTCPVLHPELFNIKLPNGADNMKYGMTVSYEFPSTFAVDLTAEYNMYKMYQKIAKSGKKGGFFSSKKWNSIEEKTFFREEFKVKWNEQDEANTLTEEQKADFEKEMRDNMFGRLAAIGLPSVTNPGVLVTPDAGPTGAAVLASSFAKNPACKVNKYCVAASIGVNILDAIFGSSSSSSSYTNIQDIRQIAEWSRSVVVYKPWISSYR